eukprot:COSAG02_NODE_1122_length_14450_cov_4.124173_13_plen_85_part_00
MILRVVDSKLCCREVVRFPRQMGAYASASPQPRVQLLHVLARQLPYRQVKSRTGDKLHFVLAARHLLERDPKPYHCDSARFSFL